MNIQVILFGAGGHAESVAGVIEAEGKYAIAGLIDSKKPIGSLAFGYEVLGREGHLPDIVNKMNFKEGLVCIGDNYQRSALTGRIKNMIPDFNFITTIHPSAAVSHDVTIGSGTVVMAQAAINHGCRVGAGCIVNTKASLDHNSVMEDFSSLAPGVTCGGQAFIGFCSAVGLGANVLGKIAIGNYTVVGAGSLVNKVIGDNKVAYGVPVQVIRDRNSDEPYLR
ncbi:MAG: NeuD/PglB/VioB family sugar acetyltransferase [Desulfobacterales bacterium]|jgi:sugar O-acyltransferase (sialic acid O-acetyltransferase NeuD family)|nr:NeuD/PglB/VioB family sugar acetyltransferase [Desulfobacterales bacterium]